MNNLTDLFFGEILNYDTLLTYNKINLEKFKQNSLMELIQSNKVNQEAIRKRLLDCLQFFSDYFQKMIMLRYVLCDNSIFFNLVSEHLKEEFGHNMSLRNDRFGRSDLWDEKLDANCSWFMWKLFTSDNEERTVLIHLVLEASANIFFKEAHKVMSKYKETNYFKMHSEADEKHEHMGLEHLQGLSPTKYERLIELQDRGWVILSGICSRIAEKALEEEMQIAFSKEA